MTSNSKLGLYEGVVVAAIRDDKSSPRPTARLSL